MDRAVSLYTDGSCNQSTGVGGWVSILIADDDKLILSGEEAATTHQRMELTAAIQALRKVGTLRLTERDILLYTDSQYLCGLPERRTKLIQAGFITRKNRTLANADLIRELFAILDKLQVGFIKIPAHQRKTGGENYNREADMRSRKIVRKSGRK